MSSKSLFISSALTFILGTIISVVFAAFMIISPMNGIQQLLVPNQDTISFEEEGTYTIYYEYNSVVDGVYYSTEDSAINELGISVSSVNTNEQMSVEQSTGTSTYSLNSREGVSIMKVTITAPGEYKVLIESPTVTEDNPIVLAFSNGNMATGIIIAVFGTMAISGFSLITSVVFLILGIKRRRK